MENTQNKQAAEQVTANQLFKYYRDEGGTLGFSDWLTREKAKGIFPLNSMLNEEVQTKLETIKKEEMQKTVLGFPLKTLYIAGAVIVVAVVVSKILKKKA
jgi:hypothetical protein